MKKIALALGALLSGVGLAAQKISVPPANVPMRTVVTAAVKGQPLPPTYEISLKWNERDSTVLSVPIKNSGEKVMKVLGVQATRGIFVGDFPAVIPAGKEDTISIVYSAADNTDGDIDIIRVLTDQGIHEIHLKVSRDTAVQFAARELRWTVGEAAAVKSVKLTVTPNTATPTSVKVFGNSTALLEKISSTEWDVKIAPRSTAKSGQFVVFVEFDRALPGKATTIIGIIEPKE